MMNATFVPPTRFSRLVLKVNAFLLIALLLGAAFIGLVAYKQGWFVHQTQIHFITPNALGLNKGMPVKLYGFTVGSVSGMDLSEEGVDVRLSIMSEYMRRIPRGSLAKHSREAGVVGAAVIDIVPGKPGPPLAQGERIDFQASRSIAEYIDDIRRQAVPAFNELKNVLGQFKGSGEDIAVSLHSLRKEMEALPQTHRDLRKLLATAERTVAEANTTLKTAERAIATIEQAVPELTTKAGSAIESIDGAAQQLRATGAEAQGTIQKAQPVLERGDAVARDAGEVFNAAKRVWPLSDSFNETTDRELPIDSFDARSKSAKP
jgi:phospholipid/cholesterol/gamma-HCH transport system substrate-binding protein